MPAALSPSYGVKKGLTVQANLKTFNKGMYSLFPSWSPGLLSMRVTRDDEVCGIFNITFKPLPQFDLHNIVIGRVSMRAAKRLIQ